MRALAAGGALAIAGLALGLFSIREFKQAGTSVVPGEPSTMLIERGPYKFTRNPIYIGMVILYFGLAVMLTSAWMLLLLIPVLIDPPAWRGRARGGLSHRQVRRRLPRSSRPACRAGCNV